MRVVKGGQQFDATCPECGQQARFIEVSVSEHFGAFFIDLLSDEERKYCCSACANVFDLRDESEPLLGAGPAKSAQELERERVDAQKRLLEEKKRQREADAARASRIEDELADLKKRLGC